MCDTTGRILLVVAAIVMMVGNGCNTFVLSSCTFIKDTNSGDTFGLLLKEIGDGDSELCTPPWYIFGKNFDENESGGDDDYFDNYSIFWSDGYMWVARVSGIVSCITAFVLWIIMWGSMCCPCAQTRRCRFVFGYFALFCGILATLMFLAFLYSDCRGSDSGCTLGFSSTVNIVVVVLYFTSSMLCFFAPSDEAPIVPYSKSEEEQEEDSPSKVTSYLEEDGDHMVETTTNADGTTITKRTTSNPDGSKTVEEMLITPAGNNNDPESLAYTF